MPTIEQIRAARALLDWSQHDLAAAAGLSQTGIARIENGTNQPNTTTLEKIRAAFENADIEFLGESGLRKRTGEIRSLRGHSGFAQFRKNVLEEARTGKADICVSNVDERLFDKWGEGEVNDNYRKAMAEIANLRCRFLSKEEDMHFSARGFAEYRWIPDNEFGDFPLYLYGNKTAMILFENDELYIFIIDHPRITNFYRKQFDDKWAQAKTPKGKQEAAE